MTKKTLDFFDLDKLQLLLEGFYQTTGFAVSILDLEGNVLAKSDWQQICKDFHRVNAKTTRRCTESDTIIASKMQAGEKYHVYKCLNGLIDVVVPIVINEEHVANLYTGQFLFTKPDREYFINQAEEFGFDKKKYLDALDKVPVISESKLKTIMDFLLFMTQQIREMTMQKIEQIKLMDKFKETERKQAAELIKKAQIASKQQNTTLAAINRLFKESMQCESSIDAAKICLAVAQEITGSRFGSVAEVNSKGRFDTLALSDPGWEECRVAADDPVAILNDMEVRGVWHAALESKHGIIINDPANHPQSVGVPQGHPPLNCFLGVPFQHKNFKGMIGIANKAGGYTEADREILEALALSFGEVINSKRAEEALAAREEQLKAIFDNSLNAIMVADDEGNYVEVNQAAADMFGYSVGELKKMNVGDLRTTSAPDAAHRYQEYLHKGFEIGEFDFVHTGGKKQIAQYHAVRVHDNFNLSVLSDITTLKTTQHELQRERNLFKAIIENIPICITRYNAKKELEYVNKEFEHKLGWQWEEAVGINLLEKMFPDESYRKQVLEYMNQAKVEWREWRTATKTGRILDCQWSNISLLDGSQVGIGIDITERNEAEKALKESEQRFMLAAQGSTDILWDWTDVSSEHLWLAERFYEVLGYNKKDIKPTLSAWKDILHPDDKERVLNTLENHLKQRAPFDIEYRLKTKTGEYKWIRARGQALWDESGQAIRMSGSLQDITERKLMEISLQEREKALKHVQQIAKIGNWEFDVKKNNITWSEELYRIYGLEPKEEQFTEEELQECVHPEDRDYHLNYAKKLDSEGKAEFEYKLVRPNGEIRWVWGQGASTFDEDGSLVKRYGFAQDITERKQAENRMRESEERFRKLYENSPFGIIINQLTKDAQGKPVDFIHMQANPATSVHLGMKVKDLLGTKATEIADQETAAKFIRLYGDVVRTGKPINIEQYFSHHDRTLLVSAFHLTGDIFITNFIDITERKRVEEALMQSQKRYHSLFNNSPVPLWEEDFSEAKDYIDTLKKRRVKDFRKYFKNNPNKVKECAQLIKITDINNSVLKLHEADSREEIFRGLSSIFTAKSYEALKEELVAIAEGRSAYEFESQVKTLKGKKKDIYLKWMVVPGYEETLEKVYISTTDITERKQAEEELQKSEEKYRLMAENSIDCIWTLDKKLRFTYLSPSLEPLMGFRPEEWIGTSLKSHFKTKTFLKAGAIAAQALKNYKTFKPVVFETKMLNNKNQEVDVEISGNVLLGSNGKLTGLQGSTKVITERKETEQKIRKLNKELERRVARRTAELTALNKELEAFSYSVSHDLRAPLRHISGYVDLLLRRFKTSLPEKGKHYLNNISSSTKEMGRLIDDLLQFSRTGRQDIRRTDIDMNSLVKDIIDTVKAGNKERQIKWEVHKLPVVSTDPSLFKSVWHNLIENAVKFTRPRSEAVIAIDCIEEKTEYIFSIRDNGVGFDMRYAKNLFGVFQRLHRVDEFEGSGIGLATVQRIIRKHGGRIWAESEIDQGTSFFFSLPRYKTNGGKK